MLSLDLDMSLVQWGVVIGASLAAAFTDLASRRIPNALTMPLLAGGLAFAVWTGGGTGLLSGVAAMLILAIPYILLFIFAGGGAGDAKMMGAIGAWLGITQGIVVLLCVAASGIVLAVVWAILQKRGREVVSNLSVIMLGMVAAVVTRTALSSGACEPRSPSEMDAVPYGVAIVVGVCVAAGSMLLWNGSF
jgi:prepilin peptidase CpaA